MTNEVHDQVLEVIRREGPITFARFMTMALYQPGSGYYAAGPERSGWGGHYLTSPELDPAFGELWAHAFEQVWDQLGRPDRFDVIEIGPGEGGFSEAVLRSVAGTPFGSALSYQLVEPQPALEERQTGAPQRIRQRVVECISRRDRAGRTGLCHGERGARQPAGQHRRATRRRDKRGVRRREGRRAPCRTRRPVHSGDRGVPRARRGEGSRGLTFRGRARGRDVRPRHRREDPVGRRRLRGLRG